MNISTSFRLLQSGPESFGNSNFDYKNVVAMRITTGGAEEGKMIINSIAYQGVTDKVEKIEN